MNPTEALAKTLNVNPSVARLIYGGLAVLAAAALVISWGSNLEDLWIGAVYVLVFAFVVAILAIIARDGILSTVVAWMVVGLFFVWGLGLVGSLVGYPPNLPPTACYLRAIFELPEKCVERLRNTGNDLRIGADEVPRPEPAVWRVGTGEARIWRVQDTPVATDHAGRVYLHFAGPVRRPAVVDLAAELSELKWRVEDRRDGGEEVKDAPDTNEVRYFKPADRDAAIELAKTIHTLHPGQPIYVRDFTRLGAFVRNGTLEVWLSNPLDTGLQG